MDRIPEGLSVADFTTKPQSVLKSEGYVLDSSKQYWDEDYNVYYFDPKTTLFRPSLCIPDTLYSDDSDATYYVKGAKNLSDGNCDKLNAQIKDDRVKSFRAGTLLEQLQNVKFQIGTDADKNPIYESFAERWSEDLTVEEKNDLFAKARVQLFAENASKYIDIDDIVLHQDVIKLLAGTDNRAKNTYY